jgi:uncharacterized SAM-binding protein YcdF (DUF218 family)
MLNQIANSLLFAPNVLVAAAVIALVLLLFKQSIMGILSLAFGLLWVLTWSLPITTLYAGGWLEKRYTQHPNVEMQTADAIVVLGGHVQGNRSNWFEPYDRQSVVNRESRAASLYFAGRAPLIVLSGGALEGDISDTAAMARSLQKLGIPNDVIIQETQSKNTLENAELTDQTLRSLQKKSIFLVTSALHMPRAMLAFESTAIKAWPAPLPPQIRWPAAEDRRIWLPDLHTLLASRSIIKEYAGLLVYWGETTFNTTQSRDAS